MDDTRKPLVETSAQASERFRAAWIREREAAYIRAAAPGAADRFPSLPGTTVILNNAHPRVSLLTRGADQSRLVVRGCGPVPKRMPKRKPVLVEMVALGKYKRLALRGITCDGEMVLPKSTAIVRFQLRDLTAAIEVTVEGRPQGSRKKYGPKRWIKRGIERPIEGRWRGPKPRI